MSQSHLFLLIILCYYTFVASCWFLWNKVLADFIFGDENYDKRFQFSITLGWVFAVIDFILVLVLGILSKHKLTRILLIAFAVLNLLFKIGYEINSAKPLPFVHFKF